MNAPYQTVSHIRKRLLSGRRPLVIRTAALSHTAKLSPRITVRPPGWRSGSSLQGLSGHCLVRPWAFFWPRLCCWPAGAWCGRPGPWKSRIATVSRVVAGWRVAFPSVASPLGTSSSRSLGRNCESSPGTSASMFSSTSAGGHYSSWRTPLRVSGLSRAVVVSTGTTISS